MNVISAELAQPLARPLHGRVALVTGSTSGIGLGIARSLAMAGASVMLNGLAEPDSVETVRLDLAQAAGTAVAYSRTDISDPASIRRMVEETVDSLGELDILVNNAGIQYVAPLETFPPEKWDQIIAINLSATFHTTRLSLPRMRMRRWGRIINIASAHGLVASPFKSAYVAAKHAVVGLTKVTALETAESGITCNAICPGYVYTPLVEQQIEQQAKAHGLPRERVIHDVLLAQQPNKRFATVDEMGAIAAFLAGEGAASITGAAIPVDGGWTAH